MLQRKIYDKLVAWKSTSNGSTALLIEGARRVGKSTVAEAFARAEYDTYLLVDFTRVTAEFKRMFLDLRTDLDEFFLYLSAYFGVQLIERRSLVIFDEVQLFPQAREFIKHLVADGRFDYVETGSLISLRTNVQDILLPSEEESVFMGPLDFEEFLWGMGEEPLAAMIRSSFEKRKGLPQELHRKASRLWREYMLVGGMPQAVVAYGSQRDMVGADKAKRAILKLYRDDIEKYGGTAAKRIKAVYDAIPGLLSKHEKKLVYTEVEEGSRARDFMTAFTWLRDAMTVNICELAEDPALGLALSADEATLKCYLSDTGLLSTMAFSGSGNVIPEVYREVLLGNAQVNEGMLAENAVAQQLVAAGHDLYFYSKASPDKEERMEVDFLVVEPYANAAMKPRVSPIEVKSGDRTVTVSLDKFKNKFGKRVGSEFVFHPRQLKVEGNRLYLPLYMAMCL
ncbi:ATP-binding protein [Adlercreutzia caecimuris]|uniref:ATP-binding protein n=1 Tax=Adlercreutzia caecimuris TaxID=671266 RepID=UPI001C3CAAF0|nr:AAA family ATPase [Adlercreutzia caecimuris]